MGFAISVVVGVAAEVINVALEATQQWWFEDTGRGWGRRDITLAHASNGQQGNVLIHMNDKGILTNRDIRWSDGIVKSCDTNTGDAFVTWKGYEAAGPMVNITNICKKAEGNLNDSGIPKDGPDGAFDGNVPSGIGAQANIKGSYTLMRKSVKRELLELKPGEVFITVRHE